MATTITQAKPLLTAAELELFDHSRAEPIKAFTAKQLASKEKRVRTLRDKYRDLYRRQTVAQRGKAGAGKATKAPPSKASADDANARTQRKADIMQEVLERFEARSALIESRSQREAATKPSKTTARTAAKPASTKSLIPVKAPVAKKASSAKTAGKADVKAPVASKARKSAAPAANAPTAAPTPASGKNGARSSKPQHTESPLSAFAAVKDGVNGAVHVDHLTGVDPAERSHKAPSDMAPTHGGKAQAPDINAPIDMVPAANRGNPVRNMSGNIAIQGHLSSSVRRAQGKKDSR